MQRQKIILELLKSPNVEIKINEFCLIDSYSELVDMDKKWIVLDISFVPFKHKANNIFWFDFVFRYSYKWQKSFGFAQWVCKKIKGSYKNFRRIIWTIDNWNRYGKLGMGSRLMAMAKGV